MAIEGARAAYWNEQLQQAQFTYDDTVRRAYEAQAAVVRDTLRRATVMLAPPRRAWWQRLLDRYMRSRIQ